MQGFCAGCAEEGWVLELVALPWKGGRSYWLCRNCVAAAVARKDMTELSSFFSPKTCANVTGARDARAEKEMRAMSDERLLEPIHWRSLVTDKPLCGALADQPATNDRDAVSCLRCVAELRRAARRVVRPGR